MSIQRSGPGLITLTKIFTFDMAHALEGYPGKCRHIHGHTYTLHVTVAGTIINEPGHPYDGMIVDFVELKSWVNEQVIDEFDHALVLRKDSALAKLPFTDEAYTRLVLTNYQPTCENLLTDIRDRLVKTLPQHLRLKRLRLFETPSSYTEWEE